MKAHHILMATFFVATMAFAQDIPIQSEVKSQNVLPDLYRSGLSFERHTLSQNHSRSLLLPDSIAKTESHNIGRIGSIRLDGMASLPLLAFDGFVIKDPSINQGQISLDLLPYDFAKSVDIYQQNLAPFGVSASSMVDFTLPLEGRQSSEITSIASTMGNWYNKLESEFPFKTGSTFAGFVSDVGFLDYYYGTNDGKDFVQYPGSQYQRYSALVKVSTANIDFLLADTFTKSKSETGDNPIFGLMEFERNALISGLRMKKDIFFSSINYTYYNQFIKLADNADTNEYNNHNLVAKAGIKDQSLPLRYQVFLGYELNILKDGARASYSNYLSVPKNGEHYINVHSEIEYTARSKSEDYSVDFNLSLNQMVALQSKKYIPIPNFSTVFRHKSGWYSSATVSRVYVVPDLTTAYGFGLPEALLAPTIQAKDGVRVGTELGWNNGSFRSYGKFSYAWLDKGFRLIDQKFVINSDNVHVWSTVFGVSYKHIIHSQHIMELTSSLAYNQQVDQNKRNDSVIPIWKWHTGIQFRDILNTWNFGLNYRLEKDIPYAQTQIDSKVRNYLDLTFRYQWFIFNLLNIANQSFRPIPENSYSPYNPGIRAEFGIQLKF